MHEAYTTIVTDDSEYEKQEEKWMEECQQAFLNL